MERRAVKRPRYAFDLALEGKGDHLRWMSCISSIRDWFKALSYHTFTTAKYGESENKPTSLCSLEPFHMLKPNE